MSRAARFVSMLLSVLFVVGVITPTESPAAELDDQTLAAATTEPGQCDADTGGSVPMDLVFVLDASGSMTTNDRQRLRVTAAQGFVDAMVEGDRIAAVDFTSSARTLIGLSTDAEAIKTALSTVRQSGGTHIGNGVTRGLDILAADGDPSKPQYVILLTDGEGTYSSTITQRAIDAGVVVHTVALGSSTNETLLQSIATQTGGVFLKSATADDLVSVFADLRDITDGDGCELGLTLPESATVDEGGSVTLDAAFAEEIDPTDLLIAWDFDGDGVYADAFGASVAFDARTIDGPASRTVAMLACDADGYCEGGTVEVAIENVAPAIAQIAPRYAIVGEEFDLAARWSDPAGESDSPYVVSWSWMGTAAPTPSMADAAPYTATSPGEMASSLTVTDDDGASDSADLSVTGVLAPLQCAADGVDTAVIWPPNHKMVAIGIQPPTQDDGTEVTATPLYVHQDEALDAEGDGDTSPDATITDGVVSVRAERSGTGDGRVYTIGYLATAADGRSCVGEVQVSVPHDAQSPAVATADVRIDSMTGEPVEVAPTAPIVELPATLERSVSPVAAVVAEGDEVHLALEIDNGTPDDALGILGAGPALGELTTIGALECDAWGDGTRCYADVVYTAGTAGNGADTFALAVVADGVAWTVPVTVNVAAVNSAPTLVAAPATIDMNEDGDPIRVRLAGWDQETTSAELGYSLAEAPSHGTLTLDGMPLADGDSIDLSEELWFTPAPNFAGTDQMTFAVTDGGDADTAPATSEVTVQVSVRGVADAPVFSPLDLSLMEDGEVEADIVVTDADSPAIAGEVSVQSLHGTVILEDTTCEPVDGGSSCVLAVRYTPEADFNGLDAFTLGASDGGLDATFEVAVTVHEVNDVPTIEPLTRVVDHGESLTLTRADLLAGADAGAPDEQGQFLTFSVTSDSPEVTVSSEGDVWSVVPAADVSGDFTLALTVCDDGQTAGFADPRCATTSLDLTVRPPNSPPTGDAVTATTDEDVSVDVTVTASDADGEDLVFTLPTGIDDADVTLAGATCTFEAGASTCMVVATVWPAADFSGEVQFSVVASDAADSVEIPVTVEVSAVDDAPLLTAPEAVLVAEDSSTDIAVVATDVDTAEAALSVRVEQVPGHGVLTVAGQAVEQGDVLAGAIATLTYAPSADYEGDDSFIVAAVDVDGAQSAPVTVAIDVTEVNDAPTLSLGSFSVEAGSAITVTTSQLLAGASTGPANESGQTLSIESFTFSDGAGATVTATADGWTVAVDSSAASTAEGVVRVCDDGTTAGASDPRCAEATVTFVVESPGPDVSAPVIVLGTSTVALGGQAVISVETYDASQPVIVAATIDGEPTAVGADGTLRYSADEAGHHVVVVTATDAQGLTSRASTTITVLGADDGVAPSITLGSPDDGATISEATVVTGSVSDDALSHWEVTLRAQGASDADAIVIGEGSGAMSDAELATIDPSVLAGGQYLLRFEAIDDGGRISRIDTYVFVEPTGKYGAFSMTFTDAVVQVAGVPLTVQRTYDSASRSREGDFGYGWSLSVNTMRLERDNEPGVSWVRENHGTFLPNYVLVPTASHTVTVVDGAAESIVFDFTPTFIDPITDGRYATAAWTERTSTGATLTPLDTTELVLASGVLISMDDAQIYDPDAYRLTMPDGRVFDFSLTDGLTRVVDANGNTLTITDGSIESSTGAAITLQRDSEGRITSVETPSGAVTGYSYNQVGDLDAVTDAAGNSTSFAYDGAHYLTAIVDPLDRIPSRQEYDEDGRLVAIVDAQGNRVEIDADPDARTTTVTDRLGNTTVQSFDEAGYLVGQVFADGTSETYTVDADGNRLSRTDGAGETWTATYDARGNRTSVTDPLGGTRSYAYDSKSRLISATDELGRVTSVEYDANGNVTVVDLPDGSSTSYTYDSQGNTLTETDETGRTWASTYSAEGLLLTQTSPGGDVTTYVYDADGRLVSTTAPEGATTSSTYDARGLVTESENALGGTTTSTYDAAGQLVEAVYASGVTATNTYDGLGRVTSRTTASGTTSYAYDLEGRIVSVTSPDGTVSTTEYDSRGRITEIAENGAVVSSTTYDAAGRVASNTDALGATTTYGYDAAGRSVLTTYADGTTVATTYDAAGQVLSSASASGTTSYTYDQRGRVLTIDAPGESTVTYNYDAAGRVLTANSAASGASTYTYDADGMLATATDANGSATAVAYDGDGRRVTVEDARGNERTWAFDDAGNLLTFTVGGVVQLAQEFDSASRLTSRAIGDAAATTYTYDTAGRLAEVDAPDAAAVTYTYDDGGQLASTTDARGTTAYTYDDRSRLVGIDTPEGSIAYTFDGASRVSAITTSAGTTEYTRDALGRVTGIVDPAGGSYTLGRDDAGLLTSIAYPNGVIESYGRDAAGRVVTVSVDFGTDTLASFEVTRDDAGRIEAFEESLAGVDRGGSYLYDAGGRLTGVSTDGGDSSSFVLDASGNRVEVTGDGAQTATVNFLDQLTSAGGVTYDYDATGNLVGVHDASGDTTLGWSASGTLTSVTGAAGAVEYGYDADGTLVSRTDASGTVGFVNDELTALPHAVAASDGSWWVYAGSQALAQSTSDGTVLYLHEDARGDVRLATDASGAVTDTFTYDVDGAVTDRTGTSTVSIGWNGEYTDTETGMVWLRARWYDPASARFVSADPWQGDASNPVSLNRYLYANADPVNNVDPRGLYATSLAEVDATVALQLEINSIAFNYYMGLLSAVRAATTVLAVSSGVLAAGGAAYWLVTDQAGDPDDNPGIDGPGSAGGVELVESDDSAPDPSPAPVIPGGPDSPTLTGVGACSLDPDTPATLYMYQRGYQAEEIIASGIRRPGGTGFIWLTSTLFASGSAAQTALALPYEAPDGYFEVPTDRIAKLCGPFEVEPAFGQPGGGNEYWTTEAIDMSGLTWHPIP